MPSQLETKQRALPADLPAAGVRSVNLIKRGTKVTPTATSILGPLAHSAGPTATTTTATAALPPPTPNTSRSNGSRPGSSASNRPPSGMTLTLSSTSNRQPKAQLMSSSNVLRGVPSVHMSTIGTRKWTLAGASDAIDAPPASAAPPTPGAPSAAVRAHNNSTAAGAAGLPPGTGSSTTRRSWDVRDAPPAAAHKSDETAAEPYNPERKISFAPGIGYGKTHPHYNTYINFPDKKLNMTVRDLEPPAVEAAALDPFAGGLGFVVARAMAAKPGDVQLTIAEDKSAEAEFDSQMKQYQKIKECLSVIQKSGDEIDKLRDADEKIADEQDRKTLMANLDKVMSETQAYAASAKKQLDEVKADNDKFAADPANDNSARKEMRVNLYNATVRKFAAAMQVFNSAHANFKQAMQDRQKRRLKNLDKTLDEKVIDKLVEEGKSQEVLDNALMSDDLRDCIGEIEQRHADVLRLERQVREVYELFKDLAVLVDVQQDSLDVIGKHIHAAKDYAEKGADHLKQAEDYQATARKRQCCIVIILMVVLAVIIFPTVASVKGGF